MACVFSVDVEDWFHILDLDTSPDLATWDHLPSRVERNFDRLLALFDEYGVRTTCFFLGWVAEKYPDLVRAAARAGHEIASHGYSHQLIYRMTAGEFSADVCRARNVIGDIVDREVAGYRAPGFSVTPSSPWFFEMLEKAGYLYDASVFPATRGHGGMPGALHVPHRTGSLVEFPVSVRPVFGKPICFFGGGYFRLFPYWLIERAAADLIRTGMPVNFYIHPREIDVEQPRLTMGYGRRFKCYVNIHSTEQKLRQLFGRFQFRTFEDLYKDFNNNGQSDGLALVNARTKC